MSLRSRLPSVQMNVGAFCVNWVAGPRDGAFLEITSGGQSVWRTRPGFSFLRFACGKAEVRESRGFFDIKDRKLKGSRAQSVDSMERTSGGEALVMRGVFDGVEAPQGLEQVDWQIEFRAIDDVQLTMTITVAAEDAWEPRTTVESWRSDDARVFGFGTQFTHADLSGRTVDVLSQEPGIGRGVQPLTWFMNAAFGAGGDDTRSNAPAPHYLTTDRMSFCLENYELSRFDMREPGVIQTEVWSSVVTARVFAGLTPSDHIEAYTRFAGRMAPLPEWIHRGAVIGMQGGTAAVRAMWSALNDAGVPVAAFWLQDWVGTRKTSVGSQLWWNWELDESHYPGWMGLTQAFEESGVRLMSYINPFLVDVDERSHASARNLYREAEEQNYLVRRSNGEPYLVQNTSFSAAMVDLTNPDAVEWLKKVIRDQVLGAGVWGWMADFGEALPLDARLFDGSDAANYHNQYPEAWARINREVIADAGLEGEVAFFTRSGFTRSPGVSTLFWLGDQLTSWSKEDGIRSAVTGLLSSGFSGFSQNHSDIGGYTTTAVPGLPVKIPFLDYRRTPELLRRWIELNAFTAVFRTHEGNQPRRNFQVDGDAETLAHFAKFARIYASLADYRIALGHDASTTGIPVVRHMWVQFPDDPATAGLAWQFMLGSALLVAPILDPKRSTVSAYLPAGRWTHVWSETVVESKTGGWYAVVAPEGFPAVFCDARHPIASSILETFRPLRDQSRSLSEPVLWPIEAPNEQ